MEDQPEHTAGVRLTERNIPAHLSHRPEQTAQHLRARQQIAGARDAGLVRCR